MSFYSSNTNTEYIRKKTFKIVMVLVGVFILIIISSLFFKYKKIQVNSSSVVQKESEDLLSKLSKIYLIKNDEKPAIISITDSSYFESQPFFSLAQKDDKVFIFTKEKRAILYRPGINKIIEVVPINNNSQGDINSTVTSGIDKNVFAPK